MVQGRSYWLKWVEIFGKWDLWLSKSKTYIIKKKCCSNSEFFQCSWNPCSASVELSYATSSVLQQVCSLCSYYRERVLTESFRSFCLASNRLSLCNDLLLSNYLKLQYNGIEWGGLQWVLRLQSLHDCNSGTWRPARNYDSYNIPQPNDQCL